MLLLPRRALLALIAACALSVAALSPAVAQRPAVTLDAETQRAMARVQAWIDGLNTVTAEFIQRNEDGAASGRFYWSRPRQTLEGGVRFDYSDPHQHFLTTSGAYVYFWDASLETQSQDAIENTPVHILMKRPLSLTGDEQLIFSGAEVRQTFRDTKVLAVNLRNAEDPQSGLLTLLFELEPIRLVRWTVQLSDGRFTAVDLYNIQIGVDIPEDLFVFRKPETRYNTFSGPQR